MSITLSGFIFAVGVLGAACSDEPQGRPTGDGGQPSEVDARAAGQPDAGDGASLEAGLGASQDAGVEPLCKVKADCFGSAAERELMTAKCPRAEMYCAAGKCIAECQKLCNAVRTDANPCEGTRLCAKQFCTMLPVQCTEAADCPLYRPVDSADWSCVDRICQLPGYSYPAQ